MKTFLDDINSINLTVTGALSIIITIFVIGNCHNAISDDIYATTSKFETQIKESGLHTATNNEETPNTYICTVI